MHVTTEQLLELEKLYGTPAKAAFRYALDEREYEIVSRSVRKGRAHDFTGFIHSDMGFACIAKHNYPPGIWRPPSGGVNEGEPLLDGILREMREETGLEVELVRYVLRSEAIFDGPSGEVLDWTTHVMYCTPAGGTLEPIDTKEIKEAKWVRPELLMGDVRDRMLASGWGGFAYRVALADRVVGELRGLGLV